MGRILLTSAFFPSFDEAGEIKVELADSLSRSFASSPSGAR